VWPCGSWMNLKNCQHFLCLQRVSRTELFVESQRHLVLRKNMPATHALHTTRKVSIWFHKFPIPTSHVSDLSRIGVSQTRPLSQWPGLRNSNSALRLMYNLKIILNLLLLNWDLWNGMEIMWPFAVEKRVIFLLTSGNSNIGRTRQLTNCKHASPVDKLNIDFMLVHRIIYKFMCACAYFSP